ncbi:DUF883 family protein [Pseudooceanicola marinus]|uniref:DUF883 family protein n=1 Tax=Pseudooceanicola marinus TaxID=396013 RepID=UPI001C94E526|nr:hypothetical protein [Pseudooceanicola marinus]MBY5972027.1 DUF883 family protein [Ferrimonas balearica]MCA1335131.1 hypothetical protein [Pseudooceanicola marinus]
MATAKSSTGSSASTESTASTTKPTDPSDPAAIQAQLDAVRADIAELTRTLGAYGQAQKDQMTASARARAEKLKHDAQAGLTEAEARARGAYDQAESAVRENPASAMAIAGGVGFLLGLVLSRR